MLGNRRTNIQRKGLGHRQAGSMGTMVVLYFQSVGSYYGHYLHQLCVCLYMLTLLCPSLFLWSQHAHDSPPSFSSPKFFTCFAKHPTSCFRGPTSRPSLALTTLRRLCLPPLFFFLARWSYCCNPPHPRLPPIQILLLSSYSFSDRPGKTCWLSLPNTRTMTPSQLSRQQRISPILSKVRKNQDWRGTKWLSSAYGECSLDTKVGGRGGC